MHYLEVTGVHNHPKYSNHWKTGKFSWKAGNFLSPASDRSGSASSHSVTKSVNDKIPVNHVKTVQNTLKLATLIWLNVSVSESVLVLTSLLFSFISDLCLLVWNYMTSYDIAHPCLISLKTWGPDLPHFSHKGSYLHLGPNNSIIAGQLCFVDCV